MRCCVKVREPTAPDGHGASSTLRGGLYSTVMSSISGVRLKPSAAVTAELPRQLLSHSQPEFGRGVLMEEGCVHAEDADPQPAPTQLEGLTDELLRCILASNLALEDLAHVGRINRRFRGLVYTTEDAWRQLYCQMFTAKQQGRGKSTNNDTWRALFQAQYIQNAKDLRLKRKVRVLKLQSSVDTSRRELLAMTADLRKERALCANVGIQIQELKRARLAKVASQAWQPQAVQLHYNQVLQATPVDSQWRLTALEQELKVSQLRISSIENSMAIRRSQLRRDEPQLRALTSS